MATWNGVIVTGNDDGKETAGTMNLTASTIRTNGSQDWFALRFVNVTVPQGATINSAAMGVYLINPSIDDVNWTLFAEDTDDGPALATTNFYISNLTRTTASATWNETDASGGAAGYQSSPDLAAVIEEIVGRAGWTSGSDIVLIARRDGGDAQFRAYDGNASQAPTLDIDYTAGGGASGSASGAATSGGSASGYGTGFGSATGAATSGAGSVTGFVTAYGTATGAAASGAAASGYGTAFGTATGAATSGASATGTATAYGTATGAATSDAAATGFGTAFGVATGAAESAGDASGFVTAYGVASGAATSGGSVATEDAYFGEAAGAATSGASAAGYGTAFEAALGAALSAAGSVAGWAEAFGAAAGAAVSAALAQVTGLDDAPLLPVWGAAGVLLPVRPLALSPAPVVQTPARPAPVFSCAEVDI